MQAANRKAAAPPSASSQEVHGAVAGSAPCLWLGTGDHRCRRRGNGAAFSHGLAGRYTGAPGSVRERTGARISPRVGSREADTLQHTDQPHGCPRRPLWRRMRCMIPQKLGTGFAAKDQCPNKDRKASRASPARGLALGAWRVYRHPGKRDGAYPGSRSEPPHGTPGLAALACPGPGSSPGQACEPKPGDDPGSPILAPAPDGAKRRAGVRGDGGSEARRVGSGCAP